jgi:hypothetical protein
MKRIFVAGIGLSLFLSVLPSEAAPPTMEVHSLAKEFVVFWDASQEMPADARIAAFKQTVGSQFPEFYGVERYGGKRTQAQQDAIIARVLTGFGPNRQAYLDKVAQFDTDLPRHIASFTATFPDFRPQVSTYFLHSMGEMDGGTREFNGRPYLIFGADLMAIVHGTSDEAAFFHHELFHIYHDEHAPECIGQGMWQPLWREGLATYVSKVMNPQASEKEMLLDFPIGSLSASKARLHEAFAQLEAVLDDSDDKFYGPLFQTAKDDTGLAPRRGYYMGYLVAREIGKSRDLPSLAHLSCADAHRLVIATVHMLKQQSAPQVAPNSDK